MRSIRCGESGLMLQVEGMTLVLDYTMMIVEQQHGQQCMSSCDVLLTCLLTAAGRDCVGGQRKGGSVHGLVPLDDVLYGSEEGTLRQVRTQ